MVIENTSSDAHKGAALYPPINYSVLVRRSGAQERAFWDEVRRECPRLSQAAIKRYFLGQMPNVVTVVIEMDYICKDHRNLFSHFYAKKFLTADPHTSRIHFFDKPYGAFTELVRDEKASDHYLGYSIIPENSIGYIGRTVLAPRAFGLTNANFFCLTTNFKVHLGGRILSVAGYPMMSQDSEATVCAHVTLWGICRYLSERYSSYRELYPYDMVLMASPELGRTSPYGKMTFKDFARVLTAFGCHPVVYAYKTDNQPQMTDSDFRDFYSYVESGIPLAVSIGGHSVGAIGHTWRTKMPARRRYWKKGLIDSSEFMDGLVIIDDNLPPYQVLGISTRVGNDSYGRILANSLPSSEITKSAYRVRDIVTMVCPLPDKAFLPAEKARAVFWELIKNLKRKSRGYFRRDTITRMFLTTGSAVKAAIADKLKKGSPANAGERQLFFTVLPHFVWVMELAKPNEYFDRRASGRLIIDATANPKEQSLIAGYLSKSLIYSAKDSDNEIYLAQKPLDQPITDFPMLTDNFRN